MSRVQELMILLQCSEPEALQVIEDDKRIDRGEDLFPLTAEQKKNAKEVRNGMKQPTVYTFSSRERKADNDKRFIINQIAELLGSQGIDFSVTNQEREIELMYNNRKLKITLSAPRT